MIKSLHTDYTKKAPSCFGRVSSDFNEEKPRRLFPEDITFEPGLNVIVGANGAGKSTLLQVLKRLSLVEFIPNKMEYKDGHFQKADAIRAIFGEDVASRVVGKDAKPKENEFFDIRMDFNQPVYVMQELKDLSDDAKMSSFENFGLTFQSMHSSRGENLVMSLVKFINEYNRRRQEDREKYSIEYILNLLKNDYITEKGELIKPYIKKHHVDLEPHVPTIIMDEPDNGMDIFNLSSVREVLISSQTQVIAVIHNPILIKALEGKANFIELTDNYLQYIDDFTNGVSLPEFCPVNKREADLQNNARKDKTTRRRKYTK